MAPIGVGLGGVVEVLDPIPAAFTVVGRIEDLRRSADDSVLFATAGSVSGLPVAENLLATSFYETGVPVRWGDVPALNAQGLLVASRAVMSDPPSQTEIDPVMRTPAGSWIDGTWALFCVLAVIFSLIEVGLLAGAALLVGSRSDQRTFATLASVGGDRRVLFRTVSASGALLGAVGGVVGALLGVMAGWALWTGIVDDGNRENHPGFHVGWLLQLAVVLLGLLSGWLASLAAARAATRVDVVAALRGARRPVAVRRRGWIAGTVTMSIGIAATVLGGFVEYLAGQPVPIGQEQPGHVGDSLLGALGIGAVVLGAITIEIGLLLVVPVLLRGAARMLARIGTAARIAGRDAARTTARSVPTLVAIMTTMFVATFVAVFVASAQADADRRYVYTMSEPGVFSGWLLTTDPQTGCFDGFVEPELVDAAVTALGTAFGGVGVDVVDAVAPQWSVDGRAAAPIVADRTPEGDIRNWLAPLSAPHIYVGDADTVAALVGREVPMGLAAALAGGEAVVLTDEYLRPDGMVRIEQRALAAGDAPSQSGWEDGRRVRADDLDAVVVRPDHAKTIGMVISPATAERLGLSYGPTRFLLDLGHEPTAAERDAFTAAQRRMQVETGGAFGLYGTYENGPGAFGGVTAWIAFGIAAIITIAASAVAIGLARADARRDDEVLDAVGAPPRTRRAIAFWQAIVVAFGGALLGAAVGLLPVLVLGMPALLAAVNGTVLATQPLGAFAPPWIQLAVAVVGIPLAIACGSWLVQRCRSAAVHREA